MKKFIALLSAAVLVISMFGVVTAFAGYDIEGKVSVYAGSTYTYKGIASYTCSSLLGKISGLGKEATFNKDNGDQMGNISLSGSASISVKIPSDAAIGTEYTITFSGSYSVDDADGIPKPHSFSTTKTIKVVEKTSTPSTSTSHAAATPTPAPTGWALAAIDIPVMAQGGQYDMAAPDGTSVPAEVLAALKEKQGVLSVNFGTYSCRIDGAALGALPEDQGPIDLGLSLDTDETFSAAVGGADGYQLHFAHHGELPGGFMFTFPAMANQPGDTVYLYYYYEGSGIIEGKQACVVDEAGYVTVTIYHCSSYFLSDTLIEGAAGILTQPQPEPTVAIEPEPTEALVATPAAQAENEAAVSETAGSDVNLDVSVLSPVEQWFGVPYAPLIAALIGAVLLSMLFTMLFTRSGLFKKRPRAAAAVGYISLDVPEVKIAPEVSMEEAVPEATEAEAEAEAMEAEAVPDDAADKADDPPEDDLY